MIYLNGKSYQSDPYETEDKLEKDVWDLRHQIFGNNRLYFEFKKKIGAKGKIRNIPDGYLIDLTSSINPKIFIVENELAIHGLKHIAVQVLEFSLSFETSKQKIKGFLREAILADSNYKTIIEEYIRTYSFQNIDFFLDKVFYSGNPSDINIIVVIDQLDEELEKALKEKFKFPIEILVLERFKSEKGEKAFYFEPFLFDLIQYKDNSDKLITSNTDFELVNTIVIPAQEEGFNTVFLGEDRWYSIRIHSSMIDKIKYIAAYQVAPESAITYYAEVDKIEIWQNSNKYVVFFKDKAKKLPNPVKLIPNGKVKALQNSRYTVLDKILKAKNLDEAF
jgi:hypothetical protein